MEPEESSDSVSFHMLGVLIIAPKDEADTYSANVAGGSVTINHDLFSLVSRGFVDVVSRPTVVDEFASAPLGAEEKDIKMKVRQVPKPYLEKCR